MKTYFGKIFYAFIFLSLLPLSLIFWANDLQKILSLPVPAFSSWGLGLALLGLAIIILGMTHLWTFGKGLPMNAYPPKKFVREGVFRFLPHPIYFGFFLLCMGYFLWMQNGAGLWIICPLVLLAILALLFGYELLFLDKSFGKNRPSALLSLPQNSNARRSLWDIASVYIYLLLPWVLIYLSFEFFGPLARTFEISFAFEKKLPVIQWTEAIYILAYPLVAFTPLFLKTKGNLRNFMLAGWVANGIGFFMFLVVPFIFQAKAFEVSGFWGNLIMFERASDTPATAFPAMHASWAIICAYFCGKIYGRKIGLIFSALAAAICISCVTVGIHCVADIAGGIFIAALGIYRRSVWSGTLRFCEFIANSWGEINIGGFRIINHGFWAGLAAFSGTLLMAGVLGEHGWSFILFFGFSSVVCAGLWGQFLEGSSKLSRPFGFYGGLIGATFAVLSYGLYFGVFWDIAFATALAAPLIQMTGRMRCLVQGCCHGAECKCDGIKYRHPNSRVLKLAGLGGKNTSPTPLYSMLGNLALFILLLRFWSMDLPAPFIVGFYLILGSLQRFVEEAYRGEPQTKIFWKLRIYQWFCIPLFIAGAVFTTMSAISPTFALSVGLREIFCALGVGAFTFFAMGCDWPKSKKRFSRLA